MHKKWCLILLLAAALLLPGCSLAQPEEGGADGENDPMVGVLVTMEPIDLFDMEGYFRDHAQTVLNGGDMRPEDTEKYQNVLWAEWNDAAQAYSFPDVDGYIWLCTSESDEEGDYSKMQSDPIFCDGMSHLSVTDEGESYTFSATIYAEYANTASSFYANPIYQTADGAVYARRAAGVLLSGGDTVGTAMTQTQNQTLTETKNGEKQTRSFECAIRFEVTAAPQTVTLFWMDAEDGVLRQDTYAAGALPEKLDADGAQFLLAVEMAADGTQTRRVYGPENETQQLEALCEGNGKLLNKQYVTLNWN